MFVPFVLFLSFFAGGAVAWYRITLPVIAAAAAVAIIATIIFRIPRFRALPEEENDGAFARRPAAVPLFLFLAAGCIVLLTRSESILPLLSPWQAIQPFFAPAFFVLTALLGFFVFSSGKTRTILALIVIHSLVQHLYLPLTHTLPWGGDVWRHIAVEERLAAGRPELPVLFGSEASVPEVFLVPQKYAYSQLWGLSVAVSRLTGASLIAVNKWLVPILWPIIVPVSLFWIGTALFRRRRWGLILAALGSLPFPFQALGGLTLPVSLGYASFFFTLALWLRYLAFGEKKCRNAALAFAVLSVFGYTLHTVLIWAVIILSLLVNRILVQRKPAVRKALFTVLAAASILFFPAIELAAHIDTVPPRAEFFTQAKQFVGQFSGWYFASRVRPDDILSGNFFFNQTPASAMAPILPLLWRWWAPLLAILLWGGAMVGLFSAFSFQLSAFQDRLLRAVIALFSASVLGGYIVGWYILAGDRLFVRRMDGMVAFVVLVFFLYGAKYFIERWRIPLAKPVAAAFAILIFSWFTTATYATGPDMRVVSVAEYETAGRLWREAEAAGEPYCVLADTWTLLPLEAISAGRIVGGGFPIDYQFGQPDRVRLYERYLKGDKDAVLIAARALTGAAGCLLTKP
jgi:hypothetical protein